MVFARVGLLGTLLIGMRKRSPSARKTTTPGSEGSAREESAWTYQRGVERAGERTYPRIAPAVSMLTTHQPSFGNASPSLILGYAKQKEIALIMTTKIDGAKKPSEAWNRRVRCRTISQREASRTDRRLR